MDLFGDLPDPTDDLQKGFRSILMKSVDANVSGSLRAVDFLRSFRRSFPTTLLTTTVQVHGVRD